MKTKFWIGLSMIGIEFLFVLIFLLSYALNFFANITKEVLMMFVGGTIFIGLNTLALVMIFSD